MSFVIPLVHSNFSFRLSLKPSVGRRPASQRLRLVSSNCTKKEGKREREERKREKETSKLCGLYTQAAIFPHARKRRRTDSPDGVASTTPSLRTHIARTQDRPTRASTGQVVTWKGSDTRPVSRARTKVSRS